MDTSAQNLLPDLQKYCILKKALLHKLVYSKWTFLIFYRQKRQKNGSFNAKERLILQSFVYSISAVAIKPSKTTSCNVSIP